MPHPVEKTPEIGLSVDFGSIHETWTTEKEIDFITKLYEKGGRPIIESYFSSLIRRVRWDKIDKDKIAAHALGFLS